MVNCVNRAGVVASNEPVIVDCWNLIEQFPFVMITHVSRMFNIEAHNLSSLAKTVGTRCCSFNMRDLIPMLTDIWTM